MCVEMISRQLVYVANMMAFVFPYKLRQAAWNFSTKLIFMWQPHLWAFPRSLHYCLPDWAVVPKSLALWVSFSVQLSPSATHPSFHCGWMSSGLQGIWQQITYENHGRIHLDLFASRTGVSNKRPESQTRVSGQSGPWKMCENYTETSTAIFQ